MQSFPHQDEGESDVCFGAVLQDLCPRVNLMSCFIADPDQDRVQVLVPSSQVTSC